jgi:phenylacetate-CoA ligase
LSRPDEKLRQYVREVPLYQVAGTLAKTATAAEVLAALPYITKQEIKKDFPKNFLRAGQSLDELVAQNRVEVEHTAGTTDNRADLLLERGWWARQEAWALSLNPHVAEVLAANPGAHRAGISSPACNGDISYANGTPSAQRRTLGSTRVLSLSRFPFLLGTADLDQMVEEALEWDPVFLDTDPAYAVVFALHCERRNVKFPKLRFMFTSYEYTSVLHQRILERVFGVPVYNLYGSTETGHLMMERADGQMAPSPKVALLDVINEDARGIGELVVSTLTNDYMPLLNYRIGDLVERRVDATGGGTTYVLHGRAPDTVKAPDGRRLTTRDIDQCFVEAEGLQHYRLHETSPGRFVLSYIPENEGDPTAAVRTVVERIEQLLRVTHRIETKRVKFLLPEGSGKFVLNYPFVG